MSGFDLVAHKALQYKRAIDAGLKSRLYRYNDDGDLEKLCKDCGEYWPADGEFFLVEEQAIDKLSRSCRACFHEARSKT